MDAGQERLRAQWEIKFFTILLSLPSRLPELVQALQSDDVESSLVELFNCDEEMAKSLRATQLDVFTSARRAKLARALEADREILAGTSPDH